MRSLREGDFAGFSGPSPPHRYVEGNLLPDDTLVDSMRATTRSDQSPNAHVVFADTRSALHQLELCTGNATEREAMCSTMPLPTTFTDFLNTSFLGPRRFIEAGSVNYTYFQFGPLNTVQTGRFCGSNTLQMVVLATLALATFNANTACIAPKSKPAGSSARL